MTSYLSTENIARNKDGVEYHPLRPFLPEGARVLFLGSFPPQRKRWCMDFYYPNFINDHWRIEGLLFFGDKNHFVDVENKRFKIDDIVAFCKEKGLAFFDTATAVRRLQDNASDKFLEVVEPTNIPALLQQVPLCNTLVATGQKATEIVAETFGCNIPPVGSWVDLRLAPSNQACIDAISCGTPNKHVDTERNIRFWRMPSSSRAYPLSLEKKAEAYKLLFE